MTITPRSSAAALMAAVASMAGRFVTGSSTISMASMEPRPRTSPTMRGCSAWIFSSLARRFWPRRCERSRNAGVAIASIERSAATQASGLPL